MRENSRHDGRPSAAAREKAALTALIEPVARALDLDLEGVTVASAGRRRVLRVIVDADGGVSLDDIAEASRQISASLDASDAMGAAPYTLELSSPGVDRPLTEPRHWRRATGRLVAVPLRAGDHDGDSDHRERPIQIEARIVGADQAGVTLATDGGESRFTYRELGPGRVQVEFGKLGEAATAGQDWGEEDRDGH
jgi:ribosome maturation factor RimP